MKQIIDIIFNHLRGQYTGFKLVTQLHILILGLFFLLCCGNSSDAYASPAMYNTCTKRLYGELPKEGKIGLVNSQCMERCDIQCGKAFGYLNYNESTEKDLYNKYKDLYDSFKDPDIKNLTLGINSEAIAQCVSTCRKGDIYSGTMYLYDNTEGVSPKSHVAVKISDAGGQIE